jgi:hypothetical protein
MTHQPSAEQDQRRVDANPAAGELPGSSDPLGVLAAGRIAELADAVAGVATLPLADHAQVYQQVHVELQGALADLDSN